MPEVAEVLTWTVAGDPLSPRFGETYRSSSGGLAQARVVFLAGCGLPGAWAQRPHFTVLETGFGLGLNFLAVWAAWRNHHRPGSQLGFHSIEAHPVAPEAIQRSVWALGPAGAELGPLADRLAAALSDRFAGGVPTPGPHTLGFGPEGLELRLWIGEVETGLAALAAAPVRADAVFLDGFSPARNPAMWTPAVLAGVAACCRPGARLATYTVAGAVRQALAGVGFVVDRKAGLPPKRHRLEAVWPGSEIGDQNDL